MRKKINGVKISDNSTEMLIIRDKSLGGEHDYAIDETISNCKNFFEFVDNCWVNKFY